MRSNPTRIILESTPSTQTVLKKMLEEDPALPHLFFVLAREQTSGRGRQGHEWISKSGNLYLSVLYRYGADSETHLTWMPLFVGVQVRQALIKLGVDESAVTLKWPNDLQTQDGAKLGGILCEKVQKNLVIGIGINVAHAPNQELAQQGRRVACLADITAGSAPTVDQTAEAIIEQLATPFDLGALQSELAQVMVPSVGTLIEWTPVNGGVSGPEAHGPQIGKVLGLGSFGELRVFSSQKELQLFSEEVKLRTPSR